MKRSIPFVILVALVSLALFSFSASERDPVPKEKSALKEAPVVTVTSSAHGMTIVKKIDVATKKVLSTTISGCSATPNDAANAYFWASFWIGASGGLVDFARAPEGSMPCGECPPEYCWSLTYH